MLKRSAITLVLALFAVSAYSFAQDNQNQPNGQDSNPTGQHERRGGGGRGGWGGGNPAETAERLAKQLNLSSDQQTKIQGILEDQQKQREALMQDNSVAPEDRRAKMMEMRKKTQSDIRAVLTPDQQKQFDEMQARREQQMGGGEWRRHQPGSENDKPKTDDQPKTDQQPKADQK